MFSSPVGRLRFLAYSLLFAFLTVVAVLACIEATMGIDAFLISKPGPGRERLALSVYLVFTLIMIPQANLTWRRAKDAAISKWVVFPYIVMLFFSIALQSLMLLTFSPYSDNANPGLAIVNLTLIGWWGHILIAPSQSQRPMEPPTLFQFRQA